MFLRSRCIGSSFLRRSAPLLLRGAQQVKQKNPPTPAAMSCVTATEQNTNMIGRGHIQVSQPSSQLRGSAQLDSMELPCPVTSSFFFFSGTGDSGSHVLRKNVSLWPPVVPCSRICSYCYLVAENLGPVSKGDWCLLCIKWNHVGNMLMMQFNSGIANYSKERLAYDVTDRELVQPSWCIASLWRLWIPYLQYSRFGKGHCYN